MSVFYPLVKLRVTHSSFSGYIYPPTRAHVFHSPHGMTDPKMKTVTRFVRILMGHLVQWFQLSPIS